MVMKIGGGLFLPPRVPPPLMLLVIVMGRRTLVDDPIPIAISPLTLFRSLGFDYKDNLASIQISSG